jgi:hypothetical protein
MRWLFFPPVFSFIFLIAAAALRNRAAAANVPEAVWGMTVAAYISMCALSLFYIIRNETKYHLGISALTQGLMLSVMSMQFGVIFMSWIGLVLFLAGLVCVFFYATGRQASSPLPSAQPDDSGGVFKRVDSLLEKLGIPVCYTDSKGVIAGSTAAFREATGRGDVDLTGEVIGDIIPVDSEEAVLGSGKWRITQKKEGARYYFSLHPAADSKPELAAPSDTMPGGVGIYDAATGLYSDAYRKIRGPEEVSRAQRYKRPLSGLLLSLKFEPNSDVSLTSEQEAMLGGAFKARVQAALRTTDCGFLMSDGRMQVLLPETPQAGAKTLLSRIITLPHDIFDEDIRTAVNPSVKGGLFFYNGATRMEYGIFSAALEESFNKSKEGIPEQAQNNQAA